MASIFPRFERFCIFIAIVKPLADSDEPETREQLLAMRRRMFAAVSAEIIKAGGDELTESEFEEFLRLMFDLEEAVDYFSGEIYETAKRNGISGSSLKEIVDLMPQSDLRFQTLLHDLEMLANDATKGWRRLGRRLPAHMAKLGDILPPDESVHVLAYALRNGMLG